MHHPPFNARFNLLPSNKIVAYIDDILIMGTTIEEHLNLLSKVLRALSQYNIKLKFGKCDFFFKFEVEFLGHFVSATGIKKMSTYIGNILKYARSDNVGQLR